MESHGLSLTQQASVRSFQFAVEAMPPEMAKAELLRLYELFLLRENQHKEQLKLATQIRCSL